MRYVPPALVLPTVRSLSSQHSSSHLGLHSKSCSAFCQILYRYSVAQAAMSRQKTFTFIHGCSLITGYACSAGYTLEKKSSLIAVGLTVHSTPVDVREKLAIPQVGHTGHISEYLCVRILMCPGTGSRPMRGHPLLCCFMGAMHVVCAG